MRSLAVPILILALFSLVSEAQADSLCKKDETPYFSCKVANAEKMISLCGKIPPNVFDAEDPVALVSQQAFLTYRFGTLRKIELEYPRQSRNSLKKFEGVWLNNHNGFVLEVYFRNGSYAYDVFFGQTEGESSSGVRVYGNNSIDGSPLKTISCQDGTSDASLFDLVHILMEFGGLVVMHPANVNH